MVVLLSYRIRIRKFKLGGGKRRVNMFNSNFFYFVFGCFFFLEFGALYRMKVEN